MLYTVTQVAKLTGFSRTKTYELVRMRRIPSIIVEGRIRVLRSALLGWIAQHAQATEAARARNSYEQRQAKAKVIERLQACKR